MSLKKREERDSDTILACFFGVCAKNYLDKRPFSFLRIIFVHVLFIIIIILLLLLNFIIIIIIINSFFNLVFISSLFMYISCIIFFNFIFLSTRAASSFCHPVCVSFIILW